MNLYQEEKIRLREEMKKLYKEIENRNKAMADMMDKNNHAWALLSAYNDQYYDLNEED